MTDPNQERDPLPTGLPKEEQVMSPEAIDPSTDENQDGVEGSVDRAHRRALRKAKDALDELRKLLH